MISSATVVRTVLTNLPSTPQGIPIRAFWLTGQTLPNCLFIYEHIPLEEEVEASAWTRDIPLIVVDLIQNCFMPQHHANEQYAIRDPLSLQLASHLLRALRQPTVDRAYAESLAMMLRVQLTQRPSSSELRSGLTPYQVKQLKKFVLAQIDQPIRVTDLANQVGLSCFYFTRQFKQSVGQTPGQFITQLKMQRAQELLLTTDESVIAVGMEVGYDSPSYFSSAFRKCVGCSPSQLRGR